MVENLIIKTLSHFEKFYQIGTSIAGELGHDLVHHCYLLMPEIDLDTKGGYFVRTMINEFYNSKSRFSKLYRPNYSNLDFDLQELPKDESQYYDANLLHKIFLELEIEGLEYEVSIYKEAMLVSNKSQVAKRLKKSRCRTIKPICDLIQNEIKERYEILNK